MRKLFGREKKRKISDSVSPIVGTSSSPESPLSPRSSSNRSENQVLSVKPAYLDLDAFRFPDGAIPLIAKTRDEEIILDRCRHCSDVFVHTFMGWTTKIIVGIPQTDDYRAISYVWGHTIQLPMRCTYCGEAFRIPMESAYKFRRLMMMTAKSGDTVWLDALSIDQTSNEDKNRIIAVMGDIYSRAKMVSVLFPKSDAEGFQNVYDLTVAATAINKHKFEFSYKDQDGHPNPRHAELVKVCKEFHAIFDYFDQNIHKYQYWRRAWTFQEWALARNITITWEGGLSQNMEFVKTSILTAATLTSIYAFTQGAYATIKMGFTQAEVPGRFERVKRLFPDELAFYPPGTLDQKEVHADVIFPSMRFGSALGLRASRDIDLSRIGHFEPISQMFALHTDLPESASERFQHRLTMALHAFGVSKREARFEADLVNCWASMCNIKYPYDAYDSYAVALQKVLYSLRTHYNIQIYNFNVNTLGASAEVDVNFQEYSTPHDQCNTGLVKGKFSDIPIFSGRADTGIYLRLALSGPKNVIHLQGSGVELRKVKDSSILFSTPFSDRDAVNHHMTRLASGTADQMVFTNVVDSVLEILSTFPPHELERVSLVVIRVPLDSPDANRVAKTIGMIAWAVIPSNVNQSSCFVAREGLNGTLVLAASDRDVLRVVSYVTITDHQSGTLLIPVAAHHLGCQCRADHRKGQIELTLQSPIRGGVTNSALLDDRLIRGSIEFESGSYTSY